MQRPRLRHLRRLRAALALLLLGAAALAFLDFGRLPAWVGAAAARPQLVPAILSLPALGAALSAGAVAVLTLLTGRVYCSTICPLGTLQDLVSRLAGRGKKRARFRHRYRKAPFRLQLALAAAAGALALVGPLGMLELLEPFSSFGRIASALLRPLSTGLWNGLARALSLAHVYAFAPAAAPPLAPGLVVVAGLWLAGLVALVLKRGRLFCNLLCPAGAILNLLSRRTALRIGIDGSSCDGCGLCERVCKAGCIDAARHEVEFPACVGCFDCLDVCPKDAVRIERGRPRRAKGAAEREGVPAPPDPGRRALLKAAALAPGALLAGAASPVLGPPLGDPRLFPAPITPPGSGHRFHFTSHCTACQLCVGACPPQVLRPSLFAYAPDGLLLPQLVYQAGACAYDCTRCGQVCPTGAIEPLSLPARHLVQVGRARFVKEDCVVVKKGKACGACVEHCPTKAITMVSYGPEGGGLKIPEVNEDLCIGCGSCEHPCPTRPLRAIYVEARRVHGTAQLAQPAPLAAPPPSAGFPF